MKKNILIIDDSALMRRVLSDIINSDERFHVSEFAVNGLDGLSILQSRGKDFAAVLLDINMPRMNGIEMLAELREQKIKATIIIVSTIAKRDAKETIRALELGAFDFVKKPDSYLDVKGNFFSDQLLQCIATATKTETKAEAFSYLVSNKAEITKPVIGKTEIGKTELGKTESGNTESGKTGLSKPDIGNQVKETSRRKAPTQLPTSAKKLVALACSTGGPKALHAVIPNLPKNLDAGVLIVQHMPGGFTKSLADRLNELSQITVKEAEDGDILSKGTVYIAKGGYQMRLIKHEDGNYRLSISKEPARHGLLPCADIMYESLVDTNFDQITCVVLTGMGGDGTAGISQLTKKQNIYVIAQNEETSIVYGMPKVIRDAGLVDEIVALNDVSDAITKNVGVH
jgi:two-component system chemotaxis response regulator CheB